MKLHINSPASGTAEISGKSGFPLNSDNVQ